MKAAVEWDEAYVLSLPSGEQDWVEFKGSQALDTGLPKVKEGEVLDTLSKQLSAFSNTGGGTIVYGVSNAREVDFGGVSLALRNGTKEWLEDVIPHLVEFELRRFNVYVIGREGPDSRIDEGKGLVLIDVPDSEDAPHQARDKRYYARVGGKSRPIGHRMVLDIVGRRKYPVMKPTFTIARRGNQGLPELRVRCQNTGKVLANYVNGWVEILGDDPIMVTRDQRDEPVYFDNKERDIVGRMAGHPPLEITRYEPVLPGLGFARDLCMLNLHQAESTEQRSHSVTWVIHADNAPPERGEIWIRDLHWIDLEDSTMRTGVRPSGRSVRGQHSRGG